MQGTESPNILLSVSRAELGVGRAPGKHQDRRFVSAPNNIASDFSIAEDPLATIVESGSDSKKREVSMLTPDNAESVLSTSFDLQTFCKRLNENATLLQDEHALFNIMRDCVFDKEVSTPI
jgi:hypothetical protein